MSDCRVVARAQPPTAGVSEPSVVVKAGGRFELADVHPGTYILEVRAADHADATLSDVKAESGRTMDAGEIVLAAGGRVKGTVVDGQGQPIAGAQVQPQVSRSGTVYGGAGSRQTNTDGAGRFELRGLPAGPLQIRARHRRFAPSMPLDVTVDPSAGVPDVTLTLHEGGRVQGTVRRRDGTPVTGMFVAVTGGAGFHGGQVNAAVQADGTFTAEHVSAGRGTAMLMAGSAGRYNSVLSKDIDIREGETSHVDLTLTDVRVTGRVTRGGKPVSNHRVTFSTGNEMVMATGMRLGLPPAPSGPSRLNAVTAADGRYEMLVSKPDRYKVRLEPLARERWGMPPLPDAVVPDVEAFTHDVVLPDGGLSGTIVDRESKRPIADARLEVRPAGGEPGGATVTTAADGRFQMALEPASYVVRVIAAKYMVEEASLTLGGAAVERHFELARGGTLKGFVRTADGRGADRATLVVLSPDGESIRTARTLVDGSFAVEGLRAATYRLFAGHDLGFALQPQVALSDAVELSLAPGARVRLLARDENGTPLKETPLRVELLTFGGTPVGIESKGAYGRPSIQTDVHGAADLPLPVGNVEIVAWATEKKLRGEARITVQPQTSDVPLVLKARR